jgi:hypothetical protein
VDILNENSVLPGPLTARTRIEVVSMTDMLSLGRLMVFRDALPAVRTAIFNTEPEMTYRP